MRVLAFPTRPRIRRGSKEPAMRRLLAATAAVLAAACLLTALSAGDTKGGPDTKAWNATVDKAVQYLKGAQQPNGGWSTDKTPGVTGIVLTGLLKSGRVSPREPV